jgi:cytochrome c-type biogenesis protein CcmH/NrfG
VRVIATAHGARRQRARLIHAQANLRNPSTVREGELELRSILHEDPTCLEASLALARLYMDLGLAARGAALLRRVLEIDPRNAVAAAALRDLTAKNRAPS